MHQEQEEVQHANVQWGSEMLLTEVHGRRLAIGFMLMQQEDHSRIGSRFSLSVVDRLSKAYVGEVQST